MTKLIKVFFTIIILIMVIGCHSGVKHWYVYPTSKEITKEELCIIEIWRPKPLDNTPLWPLAVNGVPLPEYKWFGKKDKRYIYLSPGRYRIKYSYVSKRYNYKVKYYPRWKTGGSAGPPTTRTHTQIKRSITENCFECEAGCTYENITMEYKLKENCKDK